MDQEAKQQYMNSNLEENQDGNCKVYETLNMGTILEPISLWTKERPIAHRMSLVGVGVRKEIWIGGP